MHDCVIHHVEWQEKSLFLYMEWIDILKNHPLNTTGKAKISHDSILIFEDAVELSCFYYDISKSYEEGKKTNKQTYSIPDDADIIQSTISERCVNTEINSVDEYFVNDKRIWRCSCNNDTVFEISYSNVKIYFNDLKEDSWLEFQPQN